MKCKNCEFWKEYGSVCTKTYKLVDESVRKCKHFKLKK